MPNFEKDVDEIGVLVEDDIQKEDMCQLYVKNIPIPDYQRENLKKMFSRVGKVSQCYVNNRVEGNFTYGFVRYETANEALKAIKEFDGMDLGHQPKLSVSISRKKVSHDQKFEKTANDTHMSLCSVCGAKCTTCCSGCREVKYCSKECQKIDFSAHKRTCTGINQTKQSDRNPILPCPENIQTRTNAASSAVTSLEYLTSVKFYNGEKTNLNSSYLKIDQEYTLSITKVSSKKYLYAVSMDDSTTVIRRRINDSLSKLSFGGNIEFHESKMYCVKNGAGRYRARILLTMKDICRFFLIDFGDKIFVSANDVAEITENEILEIPPLCVCGVFEEVDNFDSQLQRYKFSKDKSYLLPLKVVDYRDGLYIFAPTINHSFKITSTLVKDEIYDMQVLAIESYNRITLRSTDLVSKILYQSFHKSNSEHPISHNHAALTFKAGDLVRCMSKQDKWQRAKIISIENNTYNLLMIDSGEFVNITKEYIDVLPPYHKYLPPLVFYCELSLNLKESERNSQFNMLKNARENSKVMVKFLKIDSFGKYIIEVVESLPYNQNNPVTIKSFFGNTNSYPRNQIPIGADLIVSVFNYVSAREFYVHICRKDYTTAMMNLHNSIEKEFKDSEIKLVENIEMEKPVLVMNKASGWFRGLVCEKEDDDKYRVFYVDFGLWDSVTKDKIAHIPQKFISQAAHVIKCQLHESCLPKIAEIEKLLKPNSKSSIHLLFCSVDSDGTYTVKIPSD